MNKSFFSANRAIKNNIHYMRTVFVDYDKIGETVYRFSSKVDDDISIDMSKDRSGKYSQKDVDDVVDVEYEEYIPENELPYYGIAMRK